MLPCNYLESYVIANVIPMGPEQPPLLYYGLQNQHKNSVDHSL